jgi:hypothetical protein
MKMEPERYNRLIKPLNIATPRKAPRQEAMRLRRFLRGLVIDLYLGKCASREVPLAAPNLFE